MEAIGVVATCCDGPHRDAATVVERGSRNEFLIIIIAESTAKAY